MTTAATPHDIIAFVQEQLAGAAVDHPLGHFEWRDGSWNWNVEFAEGIRATHAEGHALIRAKQEARSRFHVVME